MWRHLKSQVIPASLYFKDLKRQQVPTLLNSSVGVGIAHRHSHCLALNNFHIVSWVRAGLLIRFWNLRAPMNLTNTVYPRGPSAQQVLTKCTVMNTAQHINHMLLLLARVSCEHSTGSVTVIKGAPHEFLSWLTCDRDQREAGHVHQAGSHEQRTPGVS